MYGCRPVESVPIFYWTDLDLAWTPYRHKRQAEDIVTCLRWHFVDPWALQMSWLWLRLLKNIYSLGYSYNIYTRKYGSHIQEFQPTLYRHYFYTNCSMGMKLIWYKDLGQTFKPIMRNRSEKHFFTEYESSILFFSSDVNPENSKIQNSTVTINIL